MIKIIYTSMELKEHSSGEKTLLHFDFIVGIE